MKYPRKDKSPVEIDTEKIAAEILNMFTEEEKTILAFGMLPAEKIQILEKQLHERARKIWPDWSDLIDDEDMEGTRLHMLADPHNQEAESTRKDFVSEVMREICSEIYSQAEMVV